MRWGPGRGARWRWSLTAALGVGASLVGLGHPAAAHPFGAPLRAAVAIDGTEVRVTVFAEEDDWVALATALDVFATDGEPVQGAATGAVQLATSPAVHGYLVDHLGVAVHDGDGAGTRPCAGAVSRLDADVLDAGAELTFRCPAAVADLTLTATLLTDVHEAYRTSVTLPAGWSPSRTLVTAAAPSASFSTGGVAAGGTTASATVGGGIVTLAVGGLLVRRWRRSRSRGGQATS